jgi:hypothetical protein
MAFEPRVGHLCYMVLQYCDVYATNKTGSSSDDEDYYQVVKHSLVITLRYTLYSDISHLHNLQLTAAVFFHHHELPS